MSSTCLYPFQCLNWRRLPASRIAALVYGQERLEGDLRASHLRLRAWSVEVALASRGTAEADALEHPLAAVLRNMRSLIDVGWLLSASTHGLGYAGALLNYSCIGLAMLHGAYPLLPAPGQKLSLVRARFMAYCIWHGCKSQAI